MNDKVKEREVIVSRLVDAPRDLVWKAMTEIEHVDRWWGPDGFKNENSIMDFKEGGSWKYDMVGPDGIRFPNLMEYKEITVREKIVADHGDQKTIWFESTITLEEKEGGTLVTIRHLFPDKQSRDEVVEKYGAIEGGKQHLANLETYVKENLA